MDDQHAHDEPNEPKPDALPETSQLSSLAARLTGQNQRLSLLLDHFSHAETQRRMVFEERIFELRSDARAAEEARSKAERAAFQAKNELATMCTQAAHFSDRAEQCQERLEAALRIADHLKRELDACRDRLVASEASRHEAQDKLRAQQDLNQELKRNLDRLQRQWQQIIERDR